jgi:hypothetical protein
MSFWDVVWFILLSYALVAYLMMLFSIIGDLFRDRDTSGLMKAVWYVLLIFFPLVTALVYVIVRGRGMAERSVRRMDAAKAEQDRYIQQVAGQTSPAAQIAEAKRLRDAGEITADEFATLKSRALAV